MSSPGKARHPRTPSSVPRLPPVAAARPAPVHVLVIEDHDDTREVLDMLLRTEGYDVTLAVDGVEGVAKYRERPADIVLVDVFMPRKDGIAVIRDLGLEFPDAVCIAMSADGDPLRRNALERARDAGARLTLRKPIEPWVLLRTLEGAVAGQRSLSRLFPASATG
jgi:CheY-like chemotaxis protein